MTTAVNPAPTRKTVSIGNYTVELRSFASGATTTAIRYKGHYISGTNADDYDTALLLAGGEIRYYTGLRLSGQASRLVFADALQPGDVLAWGTVKSVTPLEGELVIITLDNGWSTEISTTEQLSVRVD